MRKKLLHGFATCGFLLTLGAGLALAATQGPETISLSSPEAKKPAAIFPHRQHQATIKCGTCHHGKDATGKQAPYVAGQELKCTSCHNGDFANKELNDLMKVGHARCKGCHAEEKKAGKKAPTECKGCHPVKD